MAETLIAPPPGFQLVGATPEPPPGFEIQPVAPPPVPTDRLRQHFEQYAPMAAKSFTDYWDAGWQASGIGLATRGKMPEVAPSADSKWYERAIAGAGSLAGDLPAMIAGGIGGAAVGSVVPGLGTSTGAWIGSGAAPAAFRSALMETYRLNPNATTSDFIAAALRTAWETVKGGTVGAAMKFAGGATLGAMQPGAVALERGIAGAVQPIAAKTAVGITAAELAAMEAVGKGLEGKLPEWQDFVDGAIVLGGMKGSVHLATKIIAPKLATIYEQTGKKPEEVVADAVNDPVLAEEIKAKTDTLELPNAYRPLAAADEAKNAFTGEKAQEVLDQPYADISEARVPYMLNLKYVTGPDGIRSLVSRMTEVYGTQQKAQGHAKTESMADTLVNDMTGGNLARVVTGYEPGSAANAVQLKIRGDMLMQASIEASQAVKKYNEAKAQGIATDQMKLDALDAINKSAMIQAYFTGGLTESARAVEYAKRFKELREQTKRIGELVNMYGKDPDVLLKMAGDMDTPAGMAKFAKDAAKATKWDMVVEAYKAGLIGPLSQVANILGNYTFLLTHDIVDTLAALRPGGDMRAVEIPARFIGEFQGAYEGLKIASGFLSDNWRHPMEALRKLDAGSPTKAEQFRKAIPGDVGVLVRSLSFPWLSVADGAARLILERRETNAYAARTAMNEGFNPLTREFRERAASVAQNVPEDVAQSIQDYVRRGVFQDPLGPWGKGLQKTVTDSKIGSLFIPFMQTPSNIFKEMARMFPLAAPFVKGWKEDFKAGGEARDRAMAEIVVGSALLGITVPLALSGRISGYGPPDPKKNEMWRTAGNQAYSFEINGKWYSYQRIQPIGTLIGLAADMAEIWDYMNPDEQEKLPKIISIAFSQAVTNQIWLRGIVDIARGVAESDRYGPKLVQNLAASMLPASGWLGQTASLMDPYVREVNGIMDAIRNKIPVAREGLIPKRDAFGEEVKNKERLGVVSPIPVSPESEDKVLTEADRLGISSPSAPKVVHIGRGTGKIGDVKLTPEQQDLFEEVAGKIAYKILESKVNAPGWDARSPLEKKRIYATAFLRAHKVGAAAALPPEIRGEAVNEIRSRMAVELQPEAQ